MIIDPTFETGRKYEVVDDDQGIKMRGKFIAILTVFFEAIRC